ncbi:TIR domain-containing protein [bacterium]|nr:TIR domain-containing protein [bacterium]
MDGQGSQKHPVYFCFHQERDMQRARFVSAISGSVDSNRFSDWTDESWQAALESGEETLQHEMRRRLEGCSVTCLLIGERTFEKPWIGPMLQFSHELGMGILAIHVHGIPDENGNMARKGANPLGRLSYIGRDGGEYPFSSGYPTYDWDFAAGEKHLAEWIAESARRSAASGEAWESTGEGTPDWK